MKVLFAIFALFLVCQGQLMGGYTTQSPTIVTTDSAAEAALNAGETSFLEQAFSAGKITSEDLQGQVVGVATQVVAGTNYKFAVEYNSNGKPFYADLTVFSQPWTKTLELTSYEISSTVPTWVN